jgi:predicted AAA+ superfamily ATPase
LKGLQNEIKILKENIEDYKLINQEVKENLNQAELEKHEKEKEISMMMDEIKRLGSEAELSKNNKIS